MPELYTNYAGTNRKLKEVHSNYVGINRKVKELYTSYAGVNRKIFTGGVGYTVTTGGSSSSSVKWNFYINDDGSGRMDVDRPTKGKGTGYFIITFERPVKLGRGATITISGRQDVWKMGIVYIGCTEFDSSNSMSTSGDNVFSFRNTTTTETFSKLKLYIDGSFHSGGESYALLWVDPKGIKINGEPLMGMSGVLPINE
ncbi:hypothetical protein [Clostridium minihomine]|uniref:hypothetical protein n=1 Tax=Clostridium minihomine TaxID=2045012 RepID=UPI000C790305|nr:hypothetical protein [Clostridium minihomine]